MCLNGKADSFRPGEGNIPVSDKGKQTETSPESETLAHYILWSRGNSGDPAHSPKREYGLQAIQSKEAKWYAGSRTAA